MNILYFSYLSKDKGIYTSLEVASRISIINPDVRFTFAGPVEKDLYMPMKYNYVGYIESETDKRKIFQSADIFIFPTRREAFGLVLLEAMREGLPIVASREGCIPEILPNGLLFTKGDANEMASQVQYLIDNENERKRLGELNRKRYEENYTIEHYGRRMVNVFRYLDNCERNQAEVMGRLPEIS